MLDVHQMSADCQRKVSVKLKQISPDMMSNTEKVAVIGKRKSR